MLYPLFYCASKRVFTKKGLGRFMECLLVCLGPSLSAEDELTHWDETQKDPLLGRFCGTFWTRIKSWHVGVFTPRLARRPLLVKGVTAGTLGIPESLSSSCHPPTFYIGHWFPLVHPAPASHHHHLLLPTPCRDNWFLHTAVRLQMGRATSARIPQAIFSATHHLPHCLHCFYSWGLFCIQAYELFWNSLYVFMLYSWSQCKHIFQVKYSIHPLHDLQSTGVDEIWGAFWEGLGAVWEGQNPFPCPCQHWQPTRLGEPIGFSIKHSSSLFSNREYDRQVPFLLLLLPTPKSHAVLKV